MLLFYLFICVLQIYEYALGLGKHEGTLVHFQTLKLLHAFRLVEAGIVDKVCPCPFSRDVCTFHVSTIGIKIL